MRITWVNHASFVASIDNIVLICDPWIEGTAFDNGWSLLSQTRFTYEDFKNITHIFFSHEHPDHFSPSNLRKIPEPYRHRITVLFHETRDKRVVKLCKSLGFDTVELPEDSWVRLSDGVSVLCGRQGLIDSWLAIRGDEKTLLNMNDCVFEHDSELEHVADLVGSPDVLFTQFSYANWVGNPDDFESHRSHGRMKLDEMARQVETFRPQAVVPCASFVWFSHAENYFANREANRIWDVYTFATETLRVKAIVLYPGDEWTVGGEDPDSAKALEMYRADDAAIENSPPLTRSQPVSLDQLREAQQGYRRKALARNNKYLLHAIPNAVVFLTDLVVKIKISLLDDIQVLGSNDSSTPDICLASEALQYCYLYDWGGDTLKVNGRYTVPAGGDAGRFFRNFRVSAYNCTGFTVDVSLLLDFSKRYLGRKLGIPAMQKVRR